MTSLAGVAETLPGVPVFDEWSAIGQLQQWHAGAPPLELLWAQHNEHRMVIPRLLIVLDYRWAAGTGSLLLGLVLALQLAHASLLARAGGGKLAPPDRVAFGGFVVTCLFSAVQFENLRWGFQIQFVGFALAVTLAFLLLGAAAQARSSLRQAWLLAGSGTAALWATFSLAGGLLVWPMLAVVAWLLSLRRTAVLLILLGSAIVLVYFQRYGLPDHGAPLRQPGAVWRYVLNYLGGFIGPGDPHGARVVGGLGLVAFLLLAFTVVGRAPRPATVALLGIGATVVGLAAITALGRIGLGEMQGFTSRYMTLTMVFWTTLMAVARQQFRRGLPALVVRAVAIVTVVVLVARQASSIDDFDHGSSAQRAAGASLLAGVVDPAARATLFPFPIDQLVAFLRDERLSLFATGWQDLMGRSAAGVFPQPVACTGRLERREPVPSTAGQPSPGDRVGGRIVETRGLRPDAVLVVDAAGRVVGIGFGDSLPVLTRIEGWLSGSVEVPWSGYARPTAGPITAVAVARDGRRCAL